MPLPRGPPDSGSTLTEEPLEADGGSVPCLAPLGKSCPGLGLGVITCQAGGELTPTVRPLPHGRVSTRTAYKGKAHPDFVY